MPTERASSLPISSKPWSSPSAGMPASRGLELFLFAPRVQHLPLLCTSAPPTICLTTAGSAYHCHRARGARN
eukprot:1683784-Pyramimonas_sp.AAC.2